MLEIDQTKLSEEVKDKYIIENETFKFKPKDDPKDRIEAEIGDNSNIDFVPCLKIKRWDDECNVSIRLLHNEKGTEKVETVGDKIKWSRGNLEAYFYDIPDGEGASEFEVILKSKPKTNVIKFSVVDKDVDYFYQPELTQKEKDEGAERPPEVIGSYAIYAKTPKTNWISKEQARLNRIIDELVKRGKTTIIEEISAGFFDDKTDEELEKERIKLENLINKDTRIYKEYKCGKVGHIYRPKIIDSAGKEVWGILNIDKGILSIEIPQEFLDKAVYPVIVDPTFGYTAVGVFVLARTSTNINKGTAKSSLTYTASAGNTITRLSVCAACTVSGSGSIGSAVYTYVGSLPSARLITEQTITINQTTKTWFNSGALSNAMSAGTAYTVAAGNWDKGTCSELQIAYDSGASGDTSNSSAAGALTDPWSSQGTEGFLYSIYATYTAGNGAATPLLTLMGIGN